MKGFALQVRKHLPDLFLRLQFCFLPILSVKMGGQRLFHPVHLKIRIQCPVFLGNERIDFILTVGNNTQRHGLYPAGGKASFDFFPQERADFIPDHTVQTSPRLLFIDQVHVNVSGIF